MPNHPQADAGVTLSTGLIKTRLRLLARCPSPRGRLLLAMLEHVRLPYVPQIDGRHVPWPRHADPGLCAAIEADGRVLTGLDEISALLERLVPHRPLLPKAPAMRALCLALTDWAEHTLAPLTLHHQWIEPAGERQRQHDFAASDDGRRHAQRRRAVRRFLLTSGWLGAPPNQIAQALQRQLHTLDAMLSGQRFLFGQAPTLADFAIASQLSALGAAPGSTAALAQRPALVDYLERCWPMHADEPVITQGRFAPHDTGPSWTATHREGVPGGAMATVRAPLVSA